MPSGCVGKEKYPGADCIHNVRWFVSRGYVRGQDSRTEYKQMMDHADTPGQDDLDGWGNLSQLFGG
jgi:hypothetical protein